MAAELFADQVTNPDQAYPVMMRELLPVGLTGAMFAALFGAVMSSLDSMLNSAATIFSVDLYKRHLRPEASSRRLMTVGRVTTGVLVLVGCLWAPLVARAGSVFEYIQMFWGFISPGIVAAFLFGIFVPRTPPAAAFGGMIVGIPVYGLLLWLLPDVAFLHHMAITFLVISAFMATLTLRQGLDEPRRLPRAVDGVDLTPAPGAKWWAGGVIGCGGGAVCGLLVMRALSSSRNPDSDSPNALANLVAASTVSRAFSFSNRRTCLSESPRICVCFSSRSFLMSARARDTFSISYRRISTSARYAGSTA